MLEKFEDFFKEEKVNEMDLLGILEPKSDSGVIVKVFKTEDGGLILESKYDKNSNIYIDPSIFSELKKYLK